MRKYLLILQAFIILFLFSGCYEVRQKTYFTYFDTVTDIYSYAGDSEKEFEKNAELARSILQKYHTYFDIYHGYDGVNNLNTVNKNAGISPVQVDQELIDFLKYAKQLYYTTDGEMNIMMGSVLYLWYEGRTSEVPFVPQEDQLKEASEHTDIESLVIDEQNKTVFISDPSAVIDVGAIGKGYATEQAAQALEEIKAYGYVINAGGNVRAIGTKKDGSSWVTGIRNPNKENSDLALKIKMNDCSCVTSGYYERFFIKDGIRYHHIIDKDSLHPASYFASVSIITKDSALADALSTALFCMPYEEGSDLIEKLDGVDAIWIFENGDIEYTSGVDIADE